MYSESSSQPEEDVEIPDGFFPPNLGIRLDEDMSDLSQQLSTVVGNSELVTDCFQSKDTVTCDSLDLSIEDLVQKLGLAYGRRESMNSLSKPKSDSSLDNTTKKDAAQRKFEAYIRLIKTLQQPDSGLLIKERKKNFQTYKRAFAGNDLIQWMIEKGGFFTNEEALRYTSSMFESGYMVSYEMNEKFVADNSFYTFPSPNFFPNNTLEPSDWDYVVYLEKREQKGSEKYRLEDFEEERLKAFTRKFEAKRSDLECEVKKHIEQEKDLKDSDRKAWQIMEWYFWRLKRPSPKAVVPDSKTSEKEHFSEFQIQSALKPEALVKRLERKVESLRLHANMSRIKSSQSSRQIILRCEISKHLDPFIEVDLNHVNPWVVDDTTYWEKEKIVLTAHDIRLWNNSLHDLLRDSIGVGYFTVFLKKELSEENLAFYLACQALDLASSRDQFNIMVKAVFAQFIVDESPQAINIDSTLRHAILKNFTGDAKISYHVFDDSQRHIFNLMAKDTYPRFLQSEAMKEIIKNAHSGDFADILSKNTTWTSRKAAKDSHLTAVTATASGTSILSFVDKAPNKVNTINLLTHTEREKEKSIDCSEKEPVKDKERKYGFFGAFSALKRSTSLASMNKRGGNS